MAVPVEVRAADIDFCSLGDQKDMQIGSQTD